MFRFLSDGEAYEIGDEYYDKVMDDWRKVSLLVVGVEHIERSSGGRCFARRKISDNLEAEKPAHNTGILQCFNFECPALWHPYQCTSSKGHCCNVRVETQQAGA